MKLLGVAITLSVVFMVATGSAPARFKIYRFGDINVEVNIVRNETEEDNICPMAYTNMTAWERDNVITFYGFTSAFSNSRSTLSWIPCSQEKCDAGFTYRLFRAVTYSTSPNCCHGYTKDSNDGDRCPIEIEKKTILNTLNEIQGTSFLRTIRETNSNGLVKMLTRGRHSLTVFYIDNEGMDLTQIYSSHLISSPRRFVKGHIVKGLRYSDTFKDEEVLTSLAGGSIRIRFILDGGEPTILANCVLVTDVIDHVALNAVLHQVKKPIIIPQYDLLSWLKQREDLSTLFTALQQSGILDSDKTTSLTIFAPTNAAFEKLPQELLNSILASPARLSALLKQHITDFSICNVMLDSNSSPCTLIGNRLNITRTYYGLFVNDARILETDVITTNGVIHVIDTAFIPEQGLLMAEVFPASSLIASVVEQTHILSTLTNQYNLTFFAPDTNALEGLLNDTRARDGDWLTHVMNDHIIDAPYMAHDFTGPGGTPFQNFELTPQPTDDENMQQFRRTVGLMKLQCARLTRWDIEAFNGHIHEIDKVLVRPTENAWDILIRDERFSIFVKFARRVGLESVLRTDDVTVFVPENTIFHHLLQEDFNRLLTDQSHLEELVRYHIAKERMCMSDVRHLGFPPPWYRFISGHVETYLKGTHLTVVSKRDGTTINDVDIAETDIISLNGVIHVINGILLPPPVPPRLGIADFLQYGAVNKDTMMRD